MHGNPMQRNSTYGWLHKYISMYITYVHIMHRLVGERAPPCIWKPALLKTLHSLLNGKHISRPPSYIV